MNSALWSCCAGLIIFTAVVYGATLDEHIQIIDEKEFESQLSMSSTRSPDALSSRLLVSEPTASASLMTKWSEAFRGKQYNSTNSPQPIFRSQNKHKTDNGLQQPKSSKESLFSKLFYPFSGSNTTMEDNVITPQPSGGAVTRDGEFNPTGMFDKWTFGKQSRTTTSTLQTTSTSSATTTTTISRPPYTLTSTTITQSGTISRETERNQTLVPPYGAQYDNSAAFFSCLDTCDDALQLRAVGTIDGSRAIPTQYVQQFISCTDRCTRRHLKAPSPDDFGLHQPHDGSLKGGIFRALHALRESRFVIFCFIVSFAVAVAWLLGFGEKLKEFENNLLRRFPNLLPSSSYVDESIVNELSQSSSSSLRLHFDEVLYRGGQLCVYILSAQYLPNSVAQYIPWSDAAWRIATENRSLINQQDEEEILVENSDRGTEYNNTYDIPEFRRAQPKSFSTPQMSANGNSRNQPETVPLLDASGIDIELATTSN